MMDVIGVLVDSGVCEVCGGPAKAKLPIYKKYKYGRVTTGRWAYSCFGCLGKVENMTTVGVNR